jgi:hypothetical protein
MVTLAFTLLNRVLLISFHSGTRIGTIVTRERLRGNSESSGACKHVTGAMQPIRLQGCDPFAKGAHLPREEPA